MKAAVSQSRSSITIRQYPELVSTVKDTVGSSKLSIHSSRRGRGYESQVTTALNLRYSTQNRCEPSSFGKCPMGAAYAVAAGSITFLENVRFISTATNCPSVGPARYGAVCMGLNSWLSRSTRCLGTSIRPRCPGDVLSSTSSISKKAGLWVLNLAGS